MPRDSNGNASTDPVYVATPGTTIRAVQHNTPIADIIQMLTGSLARNGTGGMLANLAMGGFKITGLADGTSAQDAVTKAQLDATLGGLPQLGAWTNVASASTVNLGAQASRNLVITGTTTITSFGTAGAADNVPYLLRFSGALTLTNGANLILPGGANIVTAAGDVAIVVHDTASNWRVVGYFRAAMPPLVVGTSANNLVALDANGKLPAVDGSLLTGVGIGIWDVDIREQQASGVNGASVLAANTWSVRVLNTVVRNAIGATLASNVVTIPAGTYIAEWDAYLSASGSSSNLNKTRLYNLTAGAVIDYGATEFAGLINGSWASGTRSRGSTVFTVSTASDIRLEHYSGAGGSSSATGWAAGGGPETYANLRLRKVS